MNRIDKIILRTQSAVDVYREDGQFIDDMRFLLDRLIVAEKALDKISLDSTYPEDCQGIATDALQQIRS